MTRVRYAFVFSLATFLMSILYGTGAPVSLEVLVKQDQFLRDESLPIKVRLTNRSGQDLDLGQAPDWLTFSIERKDGGFARVLGQPFVQGEFTLESSQMATRMVNLMPYYDLSQPGRYTLTARVFIRQWGQEILSKPTSFDIIRGTTIWEKDFGVPGADRVPEVRNYKLIQMNNFKHLLFYLRVTDPSDTKVFRVLQLGQLVSFSRPEAQVDRQSNLHVLFQTAARSFYYYMVSPNGNLLLRQTHDYAATRPSLKLDEEGKILVTGGIRRIRITDIPPPSTSTMSMGERLREDSGLTNSSSDLNAPQP